MKKKFTQPLFKFVFAALLAFVNTDVKAGFTQVALSGFNHDVIANGVGVPTTSTTASFDNVNYCLVAPDYKLNATSPSPTYNLPANGVINSMSTTGVSWQLANYTGANSLKLTTSGQLGTLSLLNTNLRGDIYLLVGAGDATGTVTGNITVTFSDNSTQIFSNITFTDWFVSATNIAMQGFGRVARATGLLDGSTTTLTPKLFEVKLTMTLLNSLKAISSITLTKNTTNGSINILAANVNNVTCFPTFGLSSTNVTLNTATLKWNSVTSTLGYEYTINTSATPPSSGTYISDTFITASSLNVGSSYYLHVRNKCSATSFSAWNSILFSTLPCPAVDTPLTITNNNPGSATFNWVGSSTSGVVGYQYAVTTSNMAPTSWLLTTSSSVNLTGLTPGTTYYAWVRTNCSNTTSGWKYTTFYNPYPPCGLPSNVVVSNINMHAARITWTNGTNSISYRFSVDTNPNPPSNGGVTIFDSTYDALNLSPNTQYYIHLRTHCGGLNYSQNWRLDSFMTTSTCMSTIVPYIDSFFADRAYIRWNKSLGAKNYECVLNFSSTPPIGNGYPVFDTTAAPMNLYSGTKYYVHLRVRCDTSNASAWATDSFTTPTHCVPTAIPSVTTVTSTKVTITWSSVSVAAYYETFLSSSPVPPLVGAATSNLSYSSNTLIPNTVYYFHIRSYCSAGDISTWQTVMFKTEPVGISSVDEKVFSVEAYPNPVSNDLHIKIVGSIKEHCSVSLFDLSGKQLLEKEIIEEDTIINMNDFSSGMYILKYFDEETTGAVRLLKQ